MNTRSIHHIPAAQVCLWVGALLAPIVRPGTLAAPLGSLADVAGPFLQQPEDLSGIADLRITEIMYDPIGGNDYEFVEVKNIGATTVNMAGVAFALGIEFAFPAGSTLPAHQSVVVVSNPTAFSERYPGVPIAGPYGGQLDNGGEELLLTAPGGAPLLDFAYDDDAPWPTAAGGDGYSMVIVSPSSNPGAPASWRASTYPNGSPGQDDPAPLVRPVVVNEVLANSSLPFEDAIELANPSSQPVAIGGWYLSDSPTTLKKYRIPDGIVIPAGGHYAIYEVQFNPSPGSPLSFALDSRGDQVYATSADADGTLTGYSNGLAFGASESNLSLGRYTASTGPQFIALSRPTFGVDSPGSVQQFRTGAGAPNAGPRMGPIAINEVMYNPAAGGDEFVELLNITDYAVPLFDPAHPTDSWQFTSGISYTFPANTSLVAHGFGLVVAIDPAVFRATYQIPPSVAVFGPYEGGLSNGGERLELSKPVGSSPEFHVAVDSIAYDDQAPWPVTPDGSGPSIERIKTWEYGDDVVNWAASSVAGGSPGRRNGVSPNVTPTPTATPTPTRTPTPTATPTRTATPTQTPSVTPTASPSGTASPTPWVTPSPTSSETAPPPSMILYLPLLLRN